VKVRLLGAHNCESSDTRLVSLLIDDNLVMDAGGLTSGLSLPEQLQIKAVLLTHQHYDHIRDIPALGMNLYLAGGKIDIYSTSPVYNVLSNHLFNGEFYINFMERPPEDPAIKFNLIEPCQSRRVGNYDILAIPVVHSVPSVGYQVSSPDGKSVFYTGDTGPGLGSCWEKVSPRLLVTEVTASDRYMEFGRESGHLTPGLLKQELEYFRQVKGYLPQVITVHMSPGLEKEIESEIADVARELNCPVTLGYEGMTVEL